MSPLRIRISIILVFWICLGFSSKAQSCSCTVSQGGFSTAIQPITGNVADTTFYNFFSNSGHTGFEAPFVSNLFLYEEIGTNQLSLIYTFHEDAVSGSGSATYDLAGLPSSAFLSFMDDGIAFPPDDSSITPPTAYVIHAWGSNSDGGVFSGLGACNFNITVSPRSGSISGINTWRFVSGSQSSPVFHTFPSITAPVTISCSSSQVPTLSEWGLILLALLILVVGAIKVFNMKRSQQAAQVN